MDVTNDEWYHSADILIFSETLTKLEEKILIPHFKQVLRSDATNKICELLVVVKQEIFLIDQHIKCSEEDSH